MSGEAISISNLNVSFGRSVILPDLSLDMKAGSIIGLFGPSGAGKTTLVRAIMGMNSFKGKISVFGSSIPSFTSLRRIGYMAQSDALYEDLSAIDNLLFFAGLYGLKGEEAKRRAAGLIDFVDLKAAGKKPVRDYSGGMKRRLSLAAALIHEPQLLILDEPTVGIDPLLRKRFWDEFKRLKDEGRTIVVTTHVMDEARHCDGIILLRAGRVIANGTLKSILEDTGTETMEDAFLYYSSREEA